MSTTEEATTIVHDIRGQICPSCLLTTLREVNAQRESLKSGATVMLIKTDNRDATSTIPEALTSMGYYHNVEKKDGYYTIEIKARSKE